MPRPSVPRGRTARAGGCRDSTRDNARAVEGTEGHGGGKRRTAAPTPAAERREGIPPGKPYGGTLTSPSPYRVWGIEGSREHPMSARDNIHSDRSREDIDYDAEVRSRTQELRFQMLGAFKPSQYNAVIEELGRLATDPRTPRRTRVVAAGAYARAASAMVAAAPSVNIQQGLSISAADLLRLVQPDSPGTTRPETLPYTTTGVRALPTASDPVPNTLGTGDDDHSLRSPVGTDAFGHPEGEDGQDVRVSLPTASVLPPAPPAQGVADEEPEKGTRAHVEWTARHAPAPPAPAYERCDLCGARTDDEPGHELVCPVGRV